MQLAYELSVLSRSVSYPNLSAASAHVGLSQPQLSRIVARLEKDLGLVLLDRTSRRKTVWMAVARELAEAFGKSSRMFEGEVRRLSGEQEMHSLRIGTLEGLIEIPLALGPALFKQGLIRTLEVDVYELDELEALFLQGELDVICTFREPARRKYTFRHVVGYQTIDPVSRPGNTRILSSFEFATQRPVANAEAPLLISNSLEIRRLWFKRFGGTGTLPSVVSRKRVPGKQENSVTLIASERISSRVWKVLLGA